MPAPRPAFRRWAGAAALPWVAWAAVRSIGCERGFPLVPALAFTPYAAATSVVPLAAAAWARSPTGAVLSAAAGAALAAGVLTRRGGSPVRPDTDGARLRVATVSLRKGHVAPGAVLDLVRLHRVDVLAAQELTPRAEAALMAAGLGELLPHAHVIPARPGVVPSASGAVWTRFPVKARGAVPGGFEQPTVLLSPEDGPAVELTSVHTVPPVSPSSIRGWTRDLADLPAPSDAVLRVLAGDFNATFDHAAMRAVLARGYADAALRAGRGLAWTWRPLRLRVPRLSLDHVLIDPRISVASVELVRVAGSDHLAVVADLVLPRD
jgi:hypothetical protein